MLLGRTHIDVLHADFIQARGDQDTVSMGHSRGTLVQKNAFDILSERGFENERLSVQGVGGALNSGAYIQSAAKVIKEPLAVQRQVSFAYLANDPVSVIIGGNAGSLTASLKEFVNVLLKDNSAHSCYGTGAMGCATIANPVVGGPVPTNQNPNLIRVIRGDSIFTPAPSVGDLNGND